MLLYLCHIESSELGGGSALGEQTDCRPLPEPLSQPGQMTVTVQVVGVETAVKREEEFNMDA